LEILENIKNNPYGIKDSYHSIERSRDRSINLDTIYEKISDELPVGIEKEKNSSSTFLIIYEYNDLKDLAIGIDILNDDEIKILTVIYKSANRRKHYGN
jgi:hypothetical protein